MCEHSELQGVTSAWQTKFESSFAFKDHGTERVLNHIYLDLQSTSAFRSCKLCIKLTFISEAEFIHEFSRFEGLFTAQHKRPIDKVQAIVTYLRNYYFPQLVSAGYHVLHTNPVWKASPSISLPCHALTSVVFHVYSKSTITRQTWSDLSRSAEPVIVVLGMSGGRPLPALQLQFSTEWVARANEGVSYGTLSLSRRVFLEERLLDLLSRVNAVTTVLPSFSGIEENKWNLELTTWANHPMRADRPCRFFRMDQGDLPGILKYKWEHRDVWNYEHEGSKYIMNGTYSVSCESQLQPKEPIALTHHQA